MSQYPNPSGPYQPPAQPRTLDYARGESTVASFMNLVYAWMCVGLAVTAVVAWWIASQGMSTMMRIYQPGTYIVLIIAELALVFVVSAAIRKISPGVATFLFLVYSALNGLTLSGIFVVYHIQTIAAAFAVTAGMFAAMSVIGFVTKRDLTSLGSFLMMALIGLIIASVVNMFVASTGLDWIITYAGVAIFLGLTVYDTAMLKQLAYQTQSDSAMASRLAIVGSLNLYLDFINLFLFILRILGRSKD